LLLRFHLCSFVALLFLALTVPSSVWAQDAVARQAEEHHQRGLQLFRSASYREAAAEFAQADQLVHSRTNVMNLARCYQELGETQRALTYIDQYLREPDLPTESRARAEEIRQQLLQPGGAARGSRSLAGPWALLGSGLALLVTGSVLDIVAYAQANTERGASDPFGSTQEYEDWRDGAHHLAIAGDVLLPVGAAAAVGGLIWLLVARRSGSGQASRIRFLSIAPVGGNGVYLQTHLNF
jgi:tetratricopeptide (TPR) repeat protein